MTEIVIEVVTEILGEVVEVALERLGKRGIHNVHVHETRPPRRPEQTGNLRVVRVRDGGRSLVAARFPDEVERDS